MLTRTSADQLHQARTRDWAVSFPGLLWSIEVPRSRLEIVKPWQHPKLGDETARLLKDAAFRRKIVLPEDYPQLVEYWEALEARTPASALFRLALDRTWLFLQGWPGGTDNWYYHGSLQSAPDYLTPEPAIEDGRLWPLCRSVAGYPVLLADAANGQIVAGNNEGLLLLGTDPARETITLASLLPRGAAAMARKALKQAGEAGVWAGALTFKLPSGLTVNSEMRLTAAASGGQRLVRLSFVRRAAHGPRKGARQRLGANSPAAALAEKVTRAPSLREALHCILESHEPHAFDGILYSDIHADQGHVTVYGVGRPFEDLWGQTFAYEGTIAQNIEHNGLNYLVVDDTLDSTKSIDWVLFVPRGVRSYFARPFYRHNRLRAVLILCSVRPGTFSPDDAVQYEVLAPAFAGAVFHGTAPKA